MSNNLQLDRWDAVNRLHLFLKLRKGKSVTDKTIKDFEKLTDKLYSNFKSHDQDTISKYSQNENSVREKAIKALRSDFIVFEQGGIYKKSEISEFAFYQDKKHRAKINGVQVEITENDFKLLEYVLK